MKKLTITDIAKIAGVSKSTISNVLNNKKYVKMETKKRIKEIIKLYNYSPSPIARAIKTKKTKTIAFLTEFLRQTITSEIVYTIEKVILKHGYILNIFNIEEDLNNEVEIFDLIGNRRIDGIITAGAGKDFVKKIIIKQIPAVHFDIYKDIGNYSYVSIDNMNGGKLAAEFLIKNNHRKVGIIINESKVIDHFIMREKGFRKVFSKNNLNVEFSLHLPIKIDVIEEQIEKNREILINSGISAIFVTTDMTAIYLLDFYKRNGIKVPEEISIIGFDNIFFSNLVNPKLTTIEYNYNLAARLASENLIYKIEKGRYKNKEIIIEPKLIKRDSVIELKK